MNALIGTRAHVGPSRGNFCLWFNIRLAHYGGFQLVPTGYQLYGYLPGTCITPPLVHMF